MPKKHYLTKSRYLQGIRCTKLLWLGVHSEDLGAEPDEATLRRFQVGKQIGEYARTLFKGGVLIEQDQMHLQQAIRATRNAMATAPAIFEAAVLSDRNLCRADILRRAGKRKAWELHEVKMTGSVKDEHIPDVAFQQRCFEKVGCPISETCLLHVNREYVRKGDIDPDKLFVREWITAQTGAALDEVDSNSKEFVKVLDSAKCPDIEPGGQCRKLGQCPFFDYCNEEPEPYTIYELSRGQKVIPKLEARGILFLKDIPADFPLNRRHAQHVLSVKRKRAVVDPAGIRAHLASLEYPLYFFDFETIACAIPLFDNSRPYEVVPFQFSLHVQKKKGGKLQHVEFLPKDADDPRERLITAMLDNLGDSGSIVAYNRSFEITRINELARDYPKYRDALTSLVPRFWDLIVPFRSGDYAHLDFHGSASLKYVLPVLAPELSYKDLDIQEGGTASLKAELWYAGEMDKAEWEKVHEQLQKYCHLDTLAMVEILRVLYETAG